MMSFNMAAAEAVDALETFCDGAQMEIAGQGTEESAKAMLHSLGFVLMSVGMMIRLLMEGVS